MYASNLQRLFANLLRKSDIGYFDDTEVAKRFDSLRRHNHLSRGRQNHGSPLTDGQIAKAVLGICSIAPEWAGHSATVMQNLVPVGGPSASFREAPTLSRAIEILLSDKQARDNLIAVMLTGAESGVNSNGRALIRYRSEEDSKTVSFVSRYAVSLHCRGAEVHYDHESLFSPASRLMSLNRDFFETIARETSMFRKSKLRPASDGSEYDAEEREAGRLAKLGVRPGSRYLTLGVDTQVTWPKTECLVEFDRFKLVLLPRTRDHTQSINIDLTANNISAGDARTVANRFLSLLTWCDDQYAVLQDGWSGSPIPCPVKHRRLGSTITPHWLFCRRIHNDPSVLRALALYREARNAEDNFLISYAVLNFYKIIEIRYRGKNTRKKWLTEHFPRIEASIREEVAREFHASRDSISVGDHIHNEYRCAVAHAEDADSSDPDCATELRRLHIAAEILRLFARYLLINEMNLSDRVYED
jgi:hypothetical protein